MKMLVLGAGLSGCVIARLLYDKGIDVKIHEKKDQIGGLCITNITDSGIKYEPFGARTFHSDDKEVIKFIKKFSEFNDYIHYKGILINKKPLSFPINMESIKKLDKYPNIKKELDNLPQKKDMSDFKTACESIFGKTLYSLFIENYTKKMWGMDPSLLTSEWAPKRLFLNQNEKPLFDGEWQGLPKEGYTRLIKNISKGIQIKKNKKSFDKNKFDIIISTAPIDEMFDYKLGRLTYRSMDFDYKEAEFWENNKWGTINLPQDKEYIRKCNFKLMHRQSIAKNYIQYQRPVPYDGNNEPMYPVNTKKNDELFFKYLSLCVDTNIIPFGRLGLFRYLDMDEAIKSAIELSKILPQYIRAGKQTRLNLIKKIRDQI